MKLVVDANILFSALIKDGTTRRLWTHPGVTLIAPAYLLREFFKYEKRLKEKSALKLEEFNSLLSSLLTLVQVVSDEELDPYMPAAATLSTDKKDWIYLACALKENADIWSSDAEFKRQTRVPTHTTKELVEKIGRL